MAEILVTKPGALTKADKALLRKVGVVCVEAAEPTEVRFIRANAELESSDLALAAMKALGSAQNWNGANNLFVKLIGEALAAKKTEGG